MVAIIGTKTMAELQTHGETTSERSSEVAPTDGGAQEGDVEQVEDKFG